jgi:carbamoyl-phosphate synthase small subunit
MIEGKTREKATLVLADGTIFEGQAIGAMGKTVGEVVFNTSMTGYQEILTDPSYINQIITFTYPHIGNVGVNDLDVESNKVQVSGLIVRELSEHYSNYRATKSLEEYLVENNVVGISGIDTRELVLHIRNTGAQMGVISSCGENPEQLIAEAKSAPSMNGQDLAIAVSTTKAYDWDQGIFTNDGSTGFPGFKEYSKQELADRPLVVAIDFGIKFNILRLLTESGFRVKVVPATTSAEEILNLNPAGVFLSNGPGDPEAVTYGIETVKNLLGKKPIFGICLGHQILALAVGAKTYKLKFGHRGGNHPVRDEVTGKVEITVQNHGFAVDKDSVPKGVTITHINLNDNTVEGIAVEQLGAFSVQYHPEANPGPNDSRYLFGRFKDLVAKFSEKETTSKKLINGGSC